MCDWVKTALNRDPPDSQFCCCVPVAGIRAGNAEGGGSGILDRKGSRSMVVAGRLALFAEEVGREGPAVVSARDALDRFSCAIAAIRMAVDADGPGPLRLVVVGCEAGSPL